jgi:hypothetical protein
MPYLRLDAPWSGPFKKGDYHRSERPVDEVWNLVSRYGVTSWIQKNTSGPVPWEKWGPYAIARLRQAVEFRTAAHQGTILTRPLPLYYSLLNLLHAFFALKTDAPPTGRHGLLFKRQNQGGMFQAAAEITDGTFSDYLAATNALYKRGTLITLHEALLRVVEMASYFWTSSLGPAEVFGIRIEAYQSGNVLLHFHGGPGQEADFRTSWNEWFPNLKDVCSLEPTGTILRVDANKVDTSTYQAICDFCYQYLEANLQYYDAPLFFAIRHSRPDLDLPRPAFYFIAAFILSSMVRYEPELMLDASNPDSEDGWLIARFLEAAERYFPHLLLHWWLGPINF